MPRLTDQQYLARHDLLQQVWNSPYRDGLLALSADEQMTLHTYYATSRNQSPAKLIECRRKLAKAYPSMANVAGKCYAKFAKAQAEAFERLKDLNTFVPVVPHKYTGKIEKIQGLVNPDLDTMAKKLALVLIRHAQEMKTRSEDSIQTESE